jgi:hypothetical protein
MSYNCPEKSNQQNPQRQNSYQKPAPNTGKVNHVSIETVLAEPEVMLGTFDVNSTPATVLFDFGASQSFISQAFVRNHSIPLCAMQNPTLVNSPGESMQASYHCLLTSLFLTGVEFKVSPIVLRASGIDVILGMDWMKQQKAVNQCKEKVVVVTALNGERISIDVVIQAQPTAIVNQLDDGGNKEDPVVDEFLDVFPDDLPSMPPDRDIEFIIELLPKTAPIAKLPYRMGVNELEELKKQIKEL